MIEAVYDHLEFMEDSTSEVIEVQNEHPIKVHGLYFMYHGEKTTPRRIYFGCHFYRSDHKRQHYGGAAWCHYDNALRAVYMEDGEQYRLPQLRDVVCDYDNGVLHNFRKE